MRLNILNADTMSISSTAGLVMSILLSGTPLNQVTSKYCLGVILDESLSFNLHIEHICSTDLRALIKGRNTICMMLYWGSSTTLQAKVRPHLECTYPLWCANMSSDRYKVVRVLFSELTHLQTWGSTPYMSDLVKIGWSCPPRVCMYHERTTRWTPLHSSHWDYRWLCVLWSQDYDSTTPHQHGSPIPYSHHQLQYDHGIDSSKIEQTDCSTFKSQWDAFRIWRSSDNDSWTGGCCMSSCC